MALLVALAPACDGYAELPIQVRERAEIVVEAVSLSPGAVGTIQVAVLGPDDLIGPLWLVGTPAAIADNTHVQVVGWAHGPCRPWTATPATPDEDAAMRLCLAVYVSPSVRPEGMLIGAVVDARAQARRFTAIGEVTVP